MQHESHQQFAFETFKGIEIADALTANGDNKIWIGVGDASGHASGAWLTADEAKELCKILSRVIDAHDARLQTDHAGMPQMGTPASHNPTAFPG